MTAEDVLETGTRDETPGRRLPPAVVTLMVLVVVAAYAGIRVSERPTGWMTRQTHYSQTQKVALPGLGACVRVELTGTLRYQRSTAAEAGDRHFRDLLVSDPSMEAHAYTSCARGADQVDLGDTQIAQAWAAAGGRAIGRRASTWDGPWRDGYQINSGAPIEAHGATAMGKICLTVTPSVIAQRGDKESAALLRPVTVCGH